MKNLLDVIEFCKQNDYNIKIGSASCFLYCGCPENALSHLDEYRKYKNTKKKIVCKDFRKRKIKEVSLSELWEEHAMICILEGDEQGKFFTIQEFENRKHRFAL